MLSSNTINSVKEHLQIVPLVSQYVHLKKSGRNFVACCPFHQERTPSFFVSPENNFYKCFGCGEAGDGIDFIQKIEHLDFIDTIKLLAKKYGIKIEETIDNINEKDNSDYKIKETAYNIITHMQEYYKKQLLTTNNNDVKAYLSSRGLNDDNIISLFNIGYSPENCHEWIQYCNSNSLDLTIQKTIGIISENKNGYIDHMHGRITFALQDITGRIIGFAGRQIETSTSAHSNSNTAKYINSQESIIYHKSKILYGLSQAKKYIREEKKCYLVEGYLDVITMHKYGFCNTVASAGTSLTEDQSIILKHITDNVTIIYDSDLAGENATERAILKLISSGLMVNVIRLKDAKDPDEFMRTKTKEEIKTFFSSQEQDFISFLLQKNLINNNDLISKNRVAHEIKNIIINIKDIYYRRLCFQKLSQELGFNTHINTINNNTAPVIKKYDTNTDIIEQYEYEFLRIIINYYNPYILQNNDMNNIIKQEIVTMVFHNKDYAIIKTICQNLILENKFSVNNLISQVQDHKIKETIISMLIHNLDISEAWNEKMNIEINKEITKLPEAIKKSILNLQLFTLQKKTSIMKEKLKDKNTDDEIEVILEELNKLKTEEIKIAKQLNRITV